MSKYIANDGGHTNLNKKMPCNKSHWDNAYIYFIYNRFIYIYIYFTTFAGTCE